MAPTGDQQLDWLVPCDYVVLVHTLLSVVIAIVRKTKPSDSHDNDYDASVNY